MENKLTIKNSSVAFLSSVVLCQLGTLVFAAIGLMIASMFNITNEMFFTFLNTAIGSLILSLFMDGIIVLIFLYFNKNKDNKIIKKPKTKKIFLYILLALACYVLLYPIVVSFNSIIYKFFPANNLTYPLTTSNYFISLISMVLLPAVAEELIFRGLIFKGLQKGGNTFAIIISATMFSLFHISLEQTIYPFLMGLVLAVIMCYENNILYCIVLHFTNNFISLTLNYLKISFAFNHWSYYLIAILFLIIFITAIILIINKLKNKTPLAKIEGESVSYFTLCLSIVIILWLVLQFSIIFKG
jgi:membrane protease YdiL (CAAX protease family)